MGAKPVSTSQVSDYNKCATAWKYKYHPDYQLAQLTDGPSVSKGVMGHSALEAYYTRIKDGIPHKEAAKFVVNTLTEACFDKMAAGDHVKSQMFSELAALMKLYFEYYERDMYEWEILGIENKVADPTFEFVGRIDLTIRYRGGKFKGMIAPVDHKFLGNFWNARAVKMNAQGPNYIRALRYMYPNEKVPHVLYNEVRFRPDAKETFKRVEHDPSHVKIATITENHAVQARRIQALKLLTRAQIDEEVKPALVKTTCEWCRFDALCDAQLEKLDTTLMEQVNFKLNTYGYDDDIIEENE
jgi:hypothetical protein